MTLSEFLDQHPDTYYYHDGNEWFGVPQRKTGDEWAQWLRENPEQDSDMCDRRNENKPPIGAYFIWPKRTSLSQWRPGIYRHDGHGSILVLTETD